MITNIGNHVEYAETVDCPYCGRPVLIHAVGADIGVVTCSPPFGMLETEYRKQKAEMCGRRFLVESKTVMQFTVTGLMEAVK